jgi:tRNA-dihydrouridine synthase A
MNKSLSPWRFCIAPMMDWTDRHCRFFHRLLSRHARLYTEMVTTGALIHGDVPRHLDFNAEEHPVALQLGGSEPDDLAHCARLAERWGYEEVNLNCGCPSERVQRGAFGACLMAEPLLVRDCVKAMADAVAIPVTVKHRIGIDRVDTYGFVRDFVGTVAEGGARVFIVHARSAWLKGLSPKENREVPPLRYEFARRLKADFPDCTIVLNGGIADAAAVDDALAGLDGVMIGRYAYHEPWFLAQADQRWFGDDHAVPTREDVVQAMREYAVAAMAAGTPLRAVTRHMLGLYQGLPGARAWRRMLSDNLRLAQGDAQLISEAAGQVRAPRLAA